MFIYLFLILIIIYLKNDIYKIVKHLFKLYIFSYVPCRHHSELNCEECKNL